MKKRFSYLTLMIWTFIFVVGISVGVLASNQIGLFLNGSPIKTDVAPTVINSRVMVPIRAISESLGANVIWDNSNKSVNVITQNDIWRNSPDPWNTDTYNGVIVVSQYLAMLQGAVCDADTVLRDNLDTVFSQSVLSSPEPWNIVWYPAMVSVGSSARRLYYEILDARTVTDKNGAFSHYEVAAKLRYYDGGASEPKYQESVKIYTVIQEEYTKLQPNGSTQKLSHYVIDSEKTIGKITKDSSQMPDFFN